MAYGIDDTIQQKVDAYRGNPGALQQRYAQNKELIDLLALQKLKSEKDAAARDMQMKMQQKPQTIAQQYEAELAGRTKNEMLQGVAGVMQNRQAKQQKNLQRVAQAGLPGAAAPRQMMAQGGIVGFAQGDRVNRASRELDLDAVTQDMIDAYRNRGGQGKRARLAMSDDQIRQILAKQAGTPSITDRNTLPSTRRADAIALADAGMTNVDTTPTFPVVGGTLPGQSQAQQNNPNIGDDTPPPPPAGQEPGLADAVAALAGNMANAPTPTNTAEGILGGIKTTVPTVTAPTLDRSKADPLFDILKTDAEKQLARDPQAEKTAARDEAFDYLKLSDEDRATRERNIRERKGAETEVEGIERLRYGDPDKLRRERLIQNLIGASGTTIGSTLASGAGASIRERGRQRAGIDTLRGERQGLMDKRITAEGAMIDEVQGFKKDALASGDVAFQQAAADVRSGRSTITNLSVAELKAASAQADRVLQADLGNQKTAISERANELRAVLQVADQAFQGDLAKYKGSVQMSLKAVDALMAERKNAITEKYYDAMTALKADGNRIQLLNVTKDISELIGNFTKNYDEAFAPLIAEAQRGASNKSYKGPTVAELTALKAQAVDATTEGLNQLLDEAQGMLGDDGFGALNP
jgi:hypothetical protein